MKQMRVTVIKGSILNLYWILMKSNFGEIQSWSFPMSNWFNVEDVEC